MGNQLSDLTPPPLVNVEDCLGRLSGFVHFEEELSSSRIFKVAKVKRIDDVNSQLWVVKVFPNNISPKLLAAYRRLTQPYCCRIQSGHNLLSFSVFCPTERSVMLARDFIDQSLVDRMCTRPFLCWDEKRWIAYQLLCAIAQLHDITFPTEIGVQDGSGNFTEQTLCHGDIKAENVLLTSWGWLLLSDPAPFKPCTLPIDNPSEFTQFFGSTQRTVCYLAPERFVEHKLSSHSTRRPNVDESAVLSKSSSFQKDAMEEELSTSTQNQASRHPSGEFNLSTETTQNPSLDSVRKDTDDLASSVEKNLTARSSDDIQTFQPHMADSSIPNDNQNGRLHPTMDLFSLGCVLLELFTDGTVAFTLADLLEYRRQDCSRLNRILNQVPCEHAKSLISDLLSLDIQRRGTAVEHLALQRGKLFPELFYSVLMDYMRTFNHPQRQSPTVRVATVRQTLPDLLRQASSLGSDQLTTCAMLTCNLVTSVLRPPASVHINQTPLVSANAPHRTSNPSLSIRELTNDGQLFTYFYTDRTMDASSGNLKRSFRHIRDLFISEQGKVDVLICLLALSEHLSVNFLLDRVIPYCVDLTGPITHHSGEVRSLALDSICQLLNLVTNSSTKEDAVFELSYLTEYLFPKLVPLNFDPRSEVRLTLARCLPGLTECTSRFLEFCTLNKYTPADAEPSGDLQDRKSNNLIQSNTDSCELGKTVLRQYIQDHLVNLFSRSDRPVKRAMMNTHGLAKLANFFGRSGTNGTILSHMITYLNDKEDPNLRAAFYREIGPLSVWIGAQSVGVLRSLLEQGLIDQDELVIELCLQALIYLLRRRLLSAPVAVSFIPRAIAFIAHPNVRIRQCSVAYLTAFSRHAIQFTSPLKTTDTVGDEQRSITSNNLWSQASVYARLANPEVMHTYFLRAVRDNFTNDAVLLTNLRPNINRTLWDAFVSLVLDPTVVSSAPETLINGTGQTQQQLLDHFFHLLKERKDSRSVTRSGQTPVYSPPNSESVAVLLSKLQSLGMSELQETQLLGLSGLLTGLCDISRDRQWKQRMKNRGENSDIIPIEPRLILLETKLLHQLLSKSIGQLRQTDINAEHCHISGFERLVLYHLLSGRLLLGLGYHSGNKTTSRVLGRGLIWLPPSASNSSDTVDMSDTSIMDASAASSNPFWDKWATNGAKGMSSSERTDSVNSSYAIWHSSAADAAKSPAICWPNDRPQGTLLASLREHQPGTVCLATHCSGRLLASCSSGDGTVKLWNCGYWPVHSDPYLFTRFPSQSGTYDGYAIGGGNLSSVHCLPTHSSWTYNCRLPGESGDVKLCRGLVWVRGHTNLVVIANGQQLHCVDAATGVLCGSGDLTKSMPDNGRAIYLTAAACHQFPACLNLVNPQSMGMADTNLFTYATTGNCILTRDLREPVNGPPACCLKQNRQFGLIRSVAVHSSHTWLVTGTARGHLLSWDLRYRRPVASAHHPCNPSVSLVNLQLYETSAIVQSERSRTKASRIPPSLIKNYKEQEQGLTRQTLLVAATDRHNEVSIWDLEACASASSSAATASGYTGSNATSSPNGGGRIAATWAQPKRSPMNFDQSTPYLSVRGLVCVHTLGNILDVSQLESSFANYAHLPSVIAGGNDMRIRYWQFTRPSESKVLAWSGDELQPSPFSYRGHDMDGLRVVSEECTLSQAERTANVDGHTLIRKRTFTDISSPPSSSRVVQQPPVATPSRVFPPGGVLELYEPAPGHTNAISDMTLLRGGQLFLVSSSMDGMIKIWK